MPIPDVVSKEIRALQHQADGVVVLAITDNDYWVLDQAFGNSIELLNRDIVELREGEQNNSKDCVIAHLMETRHRTVKLRDRLSKQYEEQE